MKILKYLLIVIFHIFYSCKSPINTDTTDPDSVLELQASYDNTKRIVDTLSVALNWSEITLENFKQIKIWRQNTTDNSTEEYEEVNDDGWVLLDSTDNEFTSSYNDIIYDDDPFIYRVVYFDQDNNFKQAETTVTPRTTTHLTVPTDLLNVKETVESVLMDDGDTVFVLGVVHLVQSFSFRGKSVLLTKVNDSGTPILRWKETLDENGVAQEDSTFIILDNGIIKGCVIVGGLAKFGAGILAKGNAQIINCFVWADTATYVDGGDGGGLHLSGNVTVKNSIIYDNLASNLGSGIFVATDAENVSIINCTIVDNDIYTHSPNVEIINSILLRCNLPTDNSPTVQYSYAGQQWQDLDGTNIVGDLQLEDVENINFHLTQGSVGFDSGNPDPSYNDVDGTRNDIGAFGGPLGDWNIEYPISD